MRYFYRFVVTIIIATTGTAFAQSTNTPNKQPDSGKEDSASGGKNETGKPKLSEDQIQLDKLLLGSWGLVTKEANSEVTDELFRKAIENCRTVPLIRQLDAEPGLKTPLPQKKNITGQVVYFRTDQGLQRFQSEPSQVVLLPEIKKAGNADGRIVWQVSGQYAQFALAFAAAQQGTVALLMLEENRLYLKCENPPQQDD